MTPHRSCVLMLLAFRYLLACLLRYHLFVLGDLAALARCFEFAHFHFA